jgi:hypothetical protein
VRTTERSVCLSLSAESVIALVIFPSFMFSETAILFRYFRPAFALQNGPLDTLCGFGLGGRISDSRLVGWCKNRAECCCLPLWIARVGWLAIGPLVAGLGTSLSYKDSKKIPTDRLGVAFTYFTATIIVVVVVVVVVIIMVRACLLGCCAASSHLVVTERSNVDFF